MTAAELVRTRLVSLSPVTTLVPAARITNGAFHQDTALGAIRVNDISEGMEAFHLRGPMDRHTSTVQVDCVAASLPSANAIAQAVHGDGLGSAATGLSGFVGEVASTTVEIIRPQFKHQYFDAEERKQWVHVRRYEVQWRGSA